MSSYFSSSDIAILTGSLGNHFDSFAISTIVVYKTPIKTVNYNSNPLVGYESEETNISYTPVSGSFRCIATTPKNIAQEFGQIPDIKNEIPKNTVRIKVEQNAKDFIDNGPNQNFIVDGLNYINIQDQSVQNFLSLKYYVYFLLKEL